MKDQTDIQTIELFEPAKRGRGRPSTGNAATAAERMKKYRANKKANKVETVSPELSLLQAEVERLQKEVERLTGMLPNRRSVTKKQNEMDVRSIAFDWKEICYLGTMFTLSDCVNLSEIVAEEVRVKRLSDDVLAVYLSNDQQFRCNFNHSELLFRRSARQFPQ